MSKKRKNVDWSTDLYYGLEMEGGVIDNNYYNFDADLQEAGWRYTTDCHYMPNCWRSDAEIITDGKVAKENLRQHINNFISLLDDNWQTHPDDTGMHINVSLHGGFGERIPKNLFLLFYGLQDEFYSLVAEQRQNQQFSGKVSHHDEYYDIVQRILDCNITFFEQSDSLEEYLAEHTDLGERMYAPEVGEKYVGLAFHKLQRLGVIEFRFFDSYLDNMSNYCLLVKAMIKFANNHTAYQIKKFIDKVQDKGLDYLKKRLRIDW